MGLVDYDSDSASETESPANAPLSQPKPQSQPSSKKPAFQKVVDRANPGKIIVNLPQATPVVGPEENDRPIKRARTGAASGSLFSGLNSFLPPPKNTNRIVASSNGPKPRPGINLRTSAAPGFSRDQDGEAEGDEITSTPQTSSTMSLPTPSNKQPPVPTIPDDQKPAEDVKLVGKPMMFKPLSVTRNTKKKKPIKAPTPATSSISTEAQSQTTESASVPPLKKVSLFSIHTEEESTDNETRNGVYVPLFQSEDDISNQESHTLYTAQAQQQQESIFPTQNNPDSLNAIAQDLNLTAAERRELFGRNGGAKATTAGRVINFNMDKEYQHNEELRAAGEQQIHNPVRALQGGKHSLRQLVQNVQNQREALEDSFAKGKSNRKEASSRYGW